MACLLPFPSLTCLFFFLLFSICLVLSTIGHGHGTPLVAIAPISLHPTNKSLYTVSLRLGSPPTTKLIKFALDLSNNNLWTSSCAKKKSLSRVSCDSPVCAISRTCNAFGCGGTACQTCDSPSSSSSSSSLSVSSSDPSCTNTCVVSITNPFIKTGTTAELWQDSLILDRTDGRKLISNAPFLASSFPIGCDNYLLVNYSIPAEGVEGFTALSRAQLAMPIQLSRKLGFLPTFAYCLPSNTNAPGPLFFGSPSSYTFLPGINVTSLLSTTPLITFKEQPDEYFIKVDEIIVGGSKLAINGALLKIKKGKGGTRLSTAIRYTQLEPSIFKALSDSFTAKAAKMGIPTVPAVAPFKTCFDSRKAVATRLGYAVPQIDLLLGDNKEPVWQITGLNSVVSVSSNVFCMAFEETEAYETRSIIVGTYQQQERLIRFDLASNSLSFSPNLNGMRTTCSNFNFTSAA